MAAPVFTPAQAMPMMSPMSEEQQMMLAQMGAQATTPAAPMPPPPTANPASQVPVPPQMQNTAEYNQLKGKFAEYNNQYQGGLTQLQQYMKDYQQADQGTDFRPAAAFIGGLPQNKNPQLLEAANAMAPESQATRMKNTIAHQQKYVDDVGAMAKNSDMVKLLNGQMQQQNAAMRQANMDKRTGLQAEKMTFQEEKEARSTVNNDAMLKIYTPRLEGAAKIDELIEAAKVGKVVSNQALLGQLNAEIARLETGSQAPGLHAAEKTELNDYKAQMGALRDSITGSPQESVRPDVLLTAQKMVHELSDSYMKGIDSRMDTLSGGMRPNQQGIVKEKHKALIKTYAPRFGGSWNGLAPVKIHNKKTYIKDQETGDWVEEGD